MPWTETAPMKERIRFVTNWERDLYSMVELCERCGVSRKTGYKWGSTVALCFGVESCTRGSAPRVVLGESLSTLAVDEKGGGRADLVDLGEQEHASHQAHAAADPPFGHAKSAVKEQGPVLQDLRTPQRPPRPFPAPGPQAITPPARMPPAAGAAGLRRQWSVTGSRQLGSRGRNTRTTSPFAFHAIRLIISRHFITAAWRGGGPHPERVDRLAAVAHQGPIERKPDQARGPTHQRGGCRIAPRTSN